MTQMTKWKYLLATTSLNSTYLTVTTAVELTAINLMRHLKEGAISSRDYRKCERWTKLTKKQNWTLYTLTQKRAQSTFQQSYRELRGKFYWTFATRFCTFDDTKLQRVPIVSSLVHEIRTRLILFITQMIINFWLMRDQIIHVETLLLLYELSKNYINGYPKL